MRIRHTNRPTETSGRAGVAWFVAATWLAAMTSCAVKAPAAETPRPPAPITTPSDLFPADLDFVARIDTGRLRQNATLAPLVRDLAKSSDAELLSSLKGSFEHATAIAIGTRWMSDGFHGDGVLTIDTASAGRTNDATYDRETRASSDPSRRPIASRLAGVDIFERTAKSRGEPAIEVILRDRGIVLATAAEADAVIRVLGGGPDADRLDPPARGLVSFAGRVRPGASFPAATKMSFLREWTEGLIAYSGSLDEGRASEGGGTIEIEAAFSYATTQAAEKAAAKAKALIARFVAGGGVAGTVADSVRLTELGTSLRVRGEVPFAWLAKLH